MSEKRKYKLETIAIHSGYTPDETKSRAIPLHRTASFVFDSAEHAANLFALKELGNIYTRLTNPTISALEERVSNLEGGIAAVAFSSGTSAIYNTIINIAQSGDEIISANNVYGGTYTMFNDILPESGIQTKFVNPHNVINFKNAVTNKTRAIFIETIGNPVLGLVDIKAIANIAHAEGIPLIVDATFTTPLLLRTIEHGADIVINSLTKWIGGHGNAIGGIVVDSGNFIWKDNPRFPTFNTPAISYNGIRWAHDLGPLTPAAFAIRLRVIPLRNVGACLSPDNAWIFLQNIESFSIRVERHSKNALTVAKFLEKHNAIDWVRYPGLESHPQHDIAKKYFERGLFGGVIVINLKGGKETGEKFISALKLFSHLANVGDAKSLAIQPASTTHSQLTEEEQSQAGISPGQIRLSIGLEHIDDIIEDLNNALS